MSGVLTSHGLVLSVGLDVTTSRRTSGIGSKSRAVNLGAHIADRCTGAIHEAVVGGDRVASRKSINVAN